MKKLFLVIFCSLFLTSCGKESSSLKAWMEPSGHLKVLSTTAMIGDLVQQVGGEEVDSICLIIGDMDPHSYELVKGDDEKIKMADLIFYNGLGLEHGASVRYHLEQASNAVSLGNHLLNNQKERLLKVDGQFDPHIWMDVALFSEVIDPIVAHLSKKDPVHAHLFETRGKGLKEKLKKKDLEFKKLMQAIPEEKRFLVTSHDAFHYFTRHYLANEGEANWEERVNAPQGLAPESQMSILDIRKVSNYLCTHHVSVVFPETNVNSDSLKKIVSVCRERGLEVKVAEVPLYGDTMAGANSYLEMMEHNIQTLRKYFLTEAEEK